MTVMDNEDPALPEAEIDEQEAVIACLGDDAALLRRENPECEIAANMDAAADMLESCRAVGIRQEQIIMDQERETARLRGEHAVMARLLIEADKLLGTIEGERQEEWDMLSDLRRAIAAATIPHRPEEADLLSVRACIGA